MSERLVRGFPLFPLGIVALPTESVPLHVFEDRYKRMIEHCLQAEPGSPEGEFGIVWLSDEELKEVGCACAIERVVERMDDGRLNIVVRGTRPFRLLERQDDLPYPAGVVEFLDDEASARSADERRADDLAGGHDADDLTDEHDSDDVAGGHDADDVAGESARELYRELVEQATDREIAEPELQAMSAYEMAGTVEFGADAKQELLELRSEPARLRLLALLLRAAIKRLELIDRAQTRALSNGKVRFG
jgi:Lon protease-like protein